MGENIPTAEAIQELRDAAVALLIAAEKDTVADWAQGVDGGDIDRVWAAVDGTYPVIWTEEQCDKLNAWQDCGHVHPFTCPNHGDNWHKNEDGEELFLIAIPQGWVCRSCGYRQFWAHEFMFNGAPENPLEALARAREGGSDA